jgi:hypothetical protein
MLKKILLQIFMTLVLFSSLIAQISDNFSDGDFTKDPAWSGDSALFTVSPQLELQLNATSAGSARLYVLHSFHNNKMEWHFKIRLGFSPSANNYAKVYLCSDSPDLSNSSLVGYYLKFGENGANDAVELYFQHDGTQELVCRGTDGIIASSFSINIKILYYDTSNQWKIYIDNQLNGNYQLDAEGYSPLPFNRNAAGVYYTYTSSNKDKFFFDDFYFGAPIADTLPPEILFVKGEQNLTTIVIRFSENISSETAFSTSNYSISETQLSPESCHYSENRFDEIKLTFPEEFQEEIPYHLTLSNLADFSGNILTSVDKEIVFYKIKRNDILISEIMADPSPPVHLPQQEYIELYNRKNFPLEMSGWKIRVGSSIKSLPDFVLPAKGYCILIDDDALESFSACQNVILLSSLSITDAGQVITLYNESEEVIHSVTFRNWWHSSSIKREGGWSLEMIDPGNPCSEASNWNSSVAESGGTPGEQNSISGENPDITLPEIEKVTLQDSLTLILFFNETIISDSTNYATLFEIDRGILISSVQEMPPGNKALKISFSEPIQPNLIYTITVSDTLCDCVGNALLQGSWIQFGMPQKAQFNDLIINEIMTEPTNGEDADYIEIFNRSDKIIDLKNVKIGSGGSELPEKAVIIISDGYQLFPKLYLVLCKNPAITRKQYYVPYPERLIFCDSLPAYPNSSGTVHLTDPAFTPIDRLTYYESMHYEMLTSTEGVSLERIHFDAVTQDPDNWKSASASAGFGTPGYQNSQYSATQLSEEIFTVTPDVFSPNNDGFDDYTEFYFKFSDNENRLSLTIYDRDGNLIKTIAKNQLCGIEEHFLWDGISDRDNLAPPDLYIVKMEYWNANGNRKVLRKIVGIR